MKKYFFLLLLLATYTTILSSATANTPLSSSAQHLLNFCVTYPNMDTAQAKIIIEQLDASIGAITDAALEDLDTLRESILGFLECGLRAIPEEESDRRENPDNFFSRSIDDYFNNVTLGPIPTVASLRDFVFSTLLAYASQQPEVTNYLRKRAKSFTELFLRQQRQEARGWDRVSLSVPTSPTTPF
jgi:hypothetical protein